MPEIDKRLAQSVPEHVADEVVNPLPVIDATGGHTAVKVAPRQIDRNLNGPGKHCSPSKPPNNNTLYNIYPLYLSVDLPTKPLTKRTNSTVCHASIS
jgi:hypothetical protein